MNIHTPYLIQRARIKPNPSHKKKISENIETDYMGSAEFEFGALPRSLCAIHADLKLYHTIQVNDITNEQGNPLIVWSKIPFENIPEYVGYLKQLRAGKLYLKESSYFNADHSKNFPTLNKTNFWWDIDNNVMFSFDPAIMKVLADSVRVSIAYMDEQKAKDAVAVAGNLINKGLK